MPEDRSHRAYVPSHPLRAARAEASHLHQLEAAGQSEWTPWIAIAALILIYAALGLLMFGIIETASRILASVSL
jgi:voltage-gated potassium channel Kch